MSCKNLITLLIVCFLSVALLEADDRRSRLKNETRPEGEGSSRKERLINEGETKDKSNNTSRKDRLNNKGGKTDNQNNSNNQDGNVIVKHTTKDFITAGWMIGCPPCEGHSALIITVGDLMKRLDEKKQLQLHQLIMEFEHENGNKINSETKVTDNVTESDKVVSETTGKDEGAGKRLCDFVRNHQR